MFRVSLHHLSWIRLRRFAGVGFVMIVAVAGGSADAQSMNVTGSPASLRITTAIAGMSPTTVTEATTKYSTNTELQVAPSKITARLDAPLPEGVTLTIQLAAQTNATSMGPVALSTTAQTVVTNIPGLTSASNLTITYWLAATSAAGVVNTSSRTVTLTIGVF